MASKTVIRPINVTKSEAHFDVVVVSHLCDPGYVGSSLDTGNRPGFGGSSLASARSFPAKIKRLLPRPQAPNQPILVSLRFKQLKMAASLACVLVEKIVINVKL